MSPVQKAAAKHVSMVDLVRDVTRTVRPPYTAIDRVTRSGEIIETVNFARVKFPEQTRPMPRRLGRGDCE